MKYLFRVLLLILWGLLICLICMIWIVGNILSILYHLNFKHTFPISRISNNFYFPISNDDWNITGYEEVYKTPLDLLKGKVSNISTGSSSLQDRLLNKLQLDHEEDRIT